MKPETPGPLDAAAIAALVPHAGPMCLLGHVQAWNAESIDCEAELRRPHPLAVGSRLPATALIEYAAQAMALHGGLLNRPDLAAAPGLVSVRPNHGLLAGLRSVRLQRRWVEADRLAIRAERIGGDGGQVLYGFEVRALPDRHLLASGRAMVVFDASAGVAG